MKRWKIGRPDESAVENICRKTELSRLCAEIMTSRGLCEIEQLADFFNGSELSDPFELIDMDKAVAAINETIDKMGLICIYGDYDCDGVTATVVLFSYLECMGANVTYYIPEREEGYGLNAAAIDRIAEMGTELIVTVDNGISAINEADYIYRKGMKLVITDHHQPQEILPRAEAVVNPHRKDCPSSFKDTAGVGVALKLCAALDDGNFEMVMEQYADLAAIGTVADVVPLVGENRIIVENGLRYIKNSENYGINSLIDNCSLNRERLDSISIAFSLAPRINAAGRFGSPKDAVRALLEEDEQAEEEVRKLCLLNSRRKETEQEILEQILDFLRDNPQELLQRVLVISGEGWHHGVIGIVAARLLEMFGKPCIVISCEQNGEARGSARSIKGFHIHKCLSSCSEVLTKFGGHECAGGLSLESRHIGLFKKMVLDYARENHPLMPELTLTADRVLHGRDLTVEAVEGLKLLEPYGEGNPQPVMAVIGAKLLRVYSLAGGKHTKLELGYDGAVFQALMFFTQPSKLYYGAGDVVDMLITLDVNEYNGKKSVSAKVKDIRLHGVKQEAYFAAKKCYESFMTGEELPISYLRKMAPSREEIVGLYKLMSGYESILTDILFMRMKDKMNYSKLRLCIDILCEAKLAQFDPISGEAKLLQVDKRHDLNNSRLFVMLSELAAKV